MEETKYKQTETKCMEIGEICSLTDFTAAGSFADIASNVKYITDHVGYAQLIRTVDLKNNFNNRDSFVYVDKHAFDYLWRVNLDSEALVLPNVGNCGEVYYITPDVLPHTHNVLGPNAILLKTTDVSVRFLYYFFMTKDFQSVLSTIIAPTGQTKYNKTAFKKLQISLPPLTEQRAIASALTSIDNLIASLDKQIAKTQSVKQGVMQQLLTGKTRLKGFSEPWGTYKIDDLFDIGNGYTPSKANPLYWTNGTIPWFRLEDIRKNGRVLNDSIQHITPLAVKNDKLFPSGSFILSTSATIGEHALITVASLANQRFCFLLKKPIIRDVFDTMYFFHYLYIIGDWCRNNINIGGLNAVNIEDLKNYELVVPSSLAEQHAIASVLTAIDNQISALEAKRKKYEMVKVGMMQQLLTGKIRLS